MQYLMLATHPVMLVIFGLLIGSFLNVVIYRFPKMMERQWLKEASSMLSDGKELARASEWELERAQKHAQENEALHTQLGTLTPWTLVSPRSCCRQCSHQIRWYENIPLLSWLALRGKCSQCKAFIGFRYPLVELATAVLFWAIGQQFSDPVTVLALCGAVALLVAMAGIDWDTTYLPDDMTMLLLWTGILFATTNHALVTLPQAVFGAAIGYLSLWSIYWVFKILTGREGMGYGDFKLLAAIGAWLGVMALPMVAIIAAVVGIVAAVAIKLGPGLREGGYIPFGPFLALGAAVYPVVKFLI